MTDLKLSVPNVLHMEYMAVLETVLSLQEGLNWKDYLLSTGDALAVMSLLLGNNVGSVMTLESCSDGQRWLWLSPEADEYANQHLPHVFATTQDMSELDATAAYAGLLEELGRDKRGRKIRVADVAA